MLSTGNVGHRLAEVYQENVMEHGATDSSEQLYTALSVSVVVREVNIDVNINVNL